MRPDVSVIVPVYRIEQELPRSLESLRSQSLANVEFVLVDDGSPDRCGEICDSYAERDNRFRVIHQENGGLSAARNTGMNVAAGQYIGFLDGDDYVEAQMFERLFENARAARADVSICTKYIDQGDDVEVYYPIYEKLVWTEARPLEELLTYRRFDFGVHDKLWRAELLSDIRFEPGRVFEDYFPITQAMSKVRRAVFESVPLYHYVQRPGSITRTRLTEKKCQDRLHALDMVIDTVSSHGVPRFLPLTENLETVTLLRLAYEVASEELLRDSQLPDMLRQRISKGWVGRLTNPNTKPSKKAALMLYYVSRRTYVAVRRWSEERGSIISRAEPSLRD